MKRLFTALTIIMLVTAFMTLPAIAGDLTKSLSISDVEKVTGLSGLKLVPRDQKSKVLTGDLNFVDPSGQPVLIIQFRPLFVFEKWKADGGSFKESVSGVGDDAFMGPAFDPQFFVDFKKGDHTVVVSTVISSDDMMKTVLPMEKLIEIGKLIASRI